VICERKKEKHRRFLPFIMSLLTLRNSVPLLLILYTVQEIVCCGAVEVFVVVFDCRAGSS